MKNYVVGILSMFENELNLFKITAKSEYDAVKQGMIKMCKSDVAMKSEIEWQNSEQYPKDISDLRNIYEDFPFSVIEITAF